MVVALKNASLGGIDIKIICPYAIDHWYARAVAYSYYKELTENGIEIYEYLPGFIHGKTFCSDDNAAVVGSINLDYRSLYFHFENAVFLSECKAVHDVKADFDKTLERCREVTHEYTHEPSGIKRIIYQILRLFSPLV